jgi:hypothetical protein
MAQNTTLKEFEAVYAKLEETILDHARQYKLPQQELDWLKTVSLSSRIPLSLIVATLSVSGLPESGANSLAYGNPTPSPVKRSRNAITVLSC